MRAEEDSAKPTVKERAYTQKEIPCDGGLPVPFNFETNIFSSCSVWVKVGCEGGMLC